MSAWDREHGACAAVVGSFVGARGAYARCASCNGPDFLGFGSGASSGVPRVCWVPSRTSRGCILTSTLSTCSAHGPLGRPPGRSSLSVFRRGTTSMSSIQHMRLLRNVRSSTPERFMQASRHVLEHIVSAECQALVEIKLLRHADRKAKSGT